jgi:Family of unknown function (DUF5856)
MVLTPQSIKSKLFFLHDTAHSFHLETRSFAEHMALNTLYTELVNFKDELCELIMGYQNGKRIGKPKMEEVPDYSQEALTAFIKEGLSFSSELEKWAEDKEYCDVENTAQALSGVFARTQYLLTLS